MPTIQEWNSQQQQLRPDFGAKQTYGEQEDCAVVENNPQEQDWEAQRSLARSSQGNTRTAGPSDRSGGAFHVVPRTHH